MGIKQRHERDRGRPASDTDAARDLFVSEGYQNVSPADCRADRKPGRHLRAFAGRTTSSLHWRKRVPAPGRLRASKHRPAAVGITARSASGIFWHFYEFSRQHPQYFLLMFVDRSVPAFPRMSASPARDRRGQIRRVEERSGTVEPYVVLRLMMMGLVGVAMMRLSDRLGASENADLLAEDMLNVILAGLRSGVAIKSTGSVEHPPDETDQALQAS